MGAAKLGRWVAFLVLLISGISLFAHTIIDTDIWWHLRTGQYILDTGSIPGYDMYSYTAGGNRWIDTHWLFQVVVYGTHSMLGAYGLSLLFILVYSSVFLLLWLSCPPEKNDFAALLLFWLGLVASSSRFLARPEAFTYLMISVYTFLLFGFESGRRGQWAVFILIPLQALWANMQGLFILGPFLVFAYAAHPVATTLIRRALKRNLEPDQSRKALTLAVLLVACGAACLLNPYGLEGLFFPFTLFTRVGGMENIFARSIAEFQPPFSGYNLTLPLKYFGVFFALCAGVLALDFRNLKLSHIIIFVGTSYLALNARRNVAIFVIAMLPIAVTHAGNLMTRLREARGGRYGAAVEWASLAASACIVGAMVLQIISIVDGRHYIADKRAERFGLGFKEQNFPHGAFIFIRQNGVAGPFFNNLDIGGMFLWEMYPAEKVFIDARLEVNSAEALSEYRRAMVDPNAFAGLAERYALNAVIISHTSQDGLYLMPILGHNPQWALVYLDPIAAVFVRSVRANAAVIRKHAINIARDRIEPFAPNDTLNERGPRWLKKVMGKMSAANDVEAQNRFNLGLVYYVMGLARPAIEHLKAGLELMPSSAEGHYNLGLTYGRMGRSDTATRYYKKAIELDPRHSDAHTNLGKIYDSRGLDEEAEEEFKRAIRWAGADPVPRYNLGALYYKRGDLEAARGQWRRALKINPSFEPAKKALSLSER